MCGICGSTADPEGCAVRAMNRALTHRGPDDEGSYLDPDTGLALGARRLSIIDLSGGHQPLSSEDGSVWAALNGEIYNYPELRDGLRRRGHHFATATDTEVLVHLYEEHGPAMVHALEGMFAFAIWDRPRRRLLLARDRFGEKPLFYATQGRDLVFASELDAVCAALGADPSLDPRSIGAFLTLGYVPGELTVRRGIRQLLPAHTLVWSADRPEPVTERYWSLPDYEPTAPAELDALVGEVSDAFTRSMRRRLVADVPVGVLLSGGLDSTLVAAFAARASSLPVRTFTVGYDVGAVSETTRARHVAGVLGTTHRELTLTEDDVRLRFPAVMAGLDQPLADPALVALHAVCELARQDVTVAVGGEGADELFGGYPRYRWLARSVAWGENVPVSVLGAGARVLEQLPLSGRSQRLIDVVRPVPVADRHLRWVTDGRWPDLHGICGPSLLDAPAFDAEADATAVMERSQASSTAGRFMALDRGRWLPDDVLVKADRASMLVSLELRTPFLDRTLAELAATVSPAVHLGGGGKRLLRELLVQAVPELRGIPSKTAFRVPTAEWLRGPLRQSLHTHLLDGRACRDGWLDGRAIARAVDDHLAGRADRTPILWPALSLGLWLEAQ
ncbi:MAG: asparagine synthase (glutamine-hydrolyzing) [Solirubrobacteraceae bacterium]